MRRPVLDIALIICFAAWLAALLVGFERFRGDLPHWIKLAMHALGPTALILGACLSSGWSSRGEFDSCPGVMSKDFRPWKIDEAQLLPPSVQDYVPRGPPVAADRGAGPGRA